MLLLLSVTGFGLFLGFLRVNQKMKDFILTYAGYCLLMVESTAGILNTVWLLLIRRDPRMYTYVSLICVAFFCLLRGIEFCLHKATAGYVIRMGLFLSVMGYYGGCFLLLYYLLTGRRPRHATREYRQKKRRKLQEKRHQNPVRHRWNIAARILRYLQDCIAYDEEDFWEEVRRNIFDLVERKRK